MQSSVVICSFVISSRTPQRMSTTWVLTVSPYAQDLNLELDAVALPAVLPDARVDKLHQGVPLHQHVCDNGACEYPNHLNSRNYIRIIKEPRSIKRSVKSQIFQPWS